MSRLDIAKPTKTAADYMVIAVSPVLIMVLVHSVCFFLVDVFYRGEAAGGVRWVLFWFVLAVVLIARIGIEQGTGYAMAYGLVLAGATWVYLLVVQTNAVFGAVLLGVVWFTAHKITCNCTLVDDETDASGQGLLQPLRRLPKWFKKLQSATPAKPASAPTAPALAVPAQKAARPATAAAPGIWLIYYSLAALPIFGLGQTLLPAGDMAARHRGLVHLFCYLAAALGLLVTTSFLGLRRYLRQRYVVMPGNIAVGWIKFGVVGAAMVLVLALLLPRPGAGEAWGTLRYHVDHQLRRASEYAAKFNPHGHGSGRSGNQTPPGGQPDNQAPPSGEGPASDQHANPGEGHGEQAPDATADHDGKAGNHGGENPETPPLSPAAGVVYPWLKTLFYIIAAVVVGWLLYRYRVVIGAMLRSLWSAIRDLIAKLLGWFRPSQAVAPAETKKAPRPSFKTFKSPFLTGADQVWAPENLIVYSYDALQSWALETEAGRGLPQTPREFCRQLAEEMPEAATTLEHLAFLYGHVAYGASVPSSYDREQLRLLWHLMESPRPKRSAEEAERNLALKA